MLWFEPQPPSAQPISAVSPTMGTMPHQPSVMNISGYSPYSAMVKLPCRLASTAISAQITAQ